MKKELSIWLSLISLVLSVVATCVAIWRSPDLRFDYQGVLVGVLSLLVTMLIGWQIYNALYLKEQIKKEVLGEVDDITRLAYRALLVANYENTLRQFEAALVNGDINNMISCSGILMSIAIELEDKDLADKSLDNFLKVKKYIGHIELNEMERSFYRSIMEEVKGLGGITEKAFEVYEQNAF